MLRHAPAPPTTSSSTRPSHAAEPRSAHPAEWMQRTLGNRALAARLARPDLVLHDPDGPMEREAHRVAAALAGPHAAPTISRGDPGLARAASPGSKDMSRGLVLGDAFAARLDAAGGAGRTLDEGPRADLESRLGVGLDDVRVHSDGAAAGLCRDLRAEAFTHGRDIYFGAGRYAPTTPTGASLLAHEVTHTIQQRGGPPAVQGLIKRADFVSLAGGDSSWGWVKSSNFHKLLVAIDAYHATADTTERDTALDTVIRIGKAWKAAHGAYDTRKGDTRRWQYVGGLVAEAEAERAGVPIARGHVAPAEVIASRTRAGDAVVDQANHATDTEGHSYKFMVRALVNHRLYGRFAQRRAEMVAANKFKAFKWRKTSAELKAEAAREVVLADDPALADPLRKRDFTAAADSVSSAGVGHTWVVLLEKDDQNRVVDRQSFGLYPAIALGSAPLEARPGEIHHPDGHDSQGGNIREREWDIGFDTYKTGLTAAGRWIRNPPDYTLTSCNCTYFAQMMADTVGVTLPNAYFVLPNLSNLWNPNSLHDSLA